MQAVQVILSSQKFQTTMLKLPYAFHSAQVDPILDDFELAAQGVTFCKPTVPVICTMTATVVSQTGTFGPKYLSGQCRRAVDLLGAIRKASTTGIITEKSVILEIGPQPVISAMVKASL